MQNTVLKTCTGKNVFPWIKYQWFFISVSAIFFVMSLYYITVRGLNYGVDFKGGVKIVYQFPAEAKSQDVREAIDVLGLGDVQVISFGNEDNTNQFMIRVKYEEGKNSADLINNKLEDSFGKDKISLLSQEVVGPKVGRDLATKGLMSIIVTCVLMLIYIGFRFDFLFAPGAIIALIHDVTISAGFFAFFGKEFNLPILAALLTILGYSINDTIVIYDRIRENIVRLPKKTATVDIINVSLTETFSRTIVTSLTVLMVVGVLFYLGGGVLHDFAFCMLVGFSFGIYSTIFIASPVYLLLQKLFPQKGIKVTEARPKAA